MEEVAIVLRTFLVSFAISIVAAASVKGCAITNNPEVIRAETESKLRWAEFYAAHPDKQKRD